MREILVDLIPAMLGLMITPAAIGGGIMLLSSAQPFRTALSFMAGFVVVYSILASIVVGAASTRSEPLLSNQTKSVIELIVGLTLLGIAIALYARHGVRQEARKVKKGLLARLSSATPAAAFGAGVSFAIVNPNVPILIAGLAAVAAADTGHIVGSAALVIASVLGIAIPTVWRWLTPRTAMRYLGSVKQWIGRHDRTINIAVLVIFGTTFTLRGMVGM